MPDSEFEAKKQKFIDQKVESFERLERQIAEALKSNGDGDDSRAVVALHRAQASALAAVERLRHVGDGDLEVAVANADMALRTAYERLDAATATAAA